MELARPGPTWRVGAGADADVPADADHDGFSGPVPTPIPVAAPAETARVEITLPDGTCIRVGADVGLATLRRVMTAVRR